LLKTKGRFDSFTLHSGNLRQLREAFTTDFRYFTDRELSGAAGFICAIRAIRGSILLGCGFAALCPLPDNLPPDAL